MENGTPWSGPSFAPRFPTARSAARASRSAWSAVRVTNALRRGLTPLDAVEHRAHHLDRGHLLSLDRRHQAGGGHPAQIVDGHGHPFCVVAHAPRRRGSSVSRSASPSRFEPNTARLMARPGKSTRCGRLLRVLRRRHREHAAPGGIRLRHAQAEERQRRLHEDGAAELRGHEHDEGAHGIGQDVAEGDAQVAHARARGPPPRTASRGSTARSTRITRAARGMMGIGDGDDHVVEGRAQRRRHHQGEHEQGQPLEDVQHALGDEIRLAADVAGQEPDDAAEEGAQHATRRGPR